MMVAAPVSPAEFKPTATRVRRMGWFLTLDQILADRLIATAFRRDRARLMNGGVPTQYAVLRWAFRIFDDATSDGKLLLLPPAPTPDRRRHGGLRERLSELSHEERVATSLMIVEEFSPDQAALLSGRSKDALEDALMNAIGHLSIRGA